MRTMTVLALALSASVAVSAPAQAGRIKDSMQGVTVDLASCLDVVTGTLGGSATHVEFESRGGEPVYEFIIKTPSVTYYAGCSGLTGKIADVDVIVSPADERFKARAKIDAKQAGEIATKLHPGEIEEVKAIFTSNGNVWFEVEVELQAGEGELNVWVDAETSRVVRVDVEYWEIGASGE